MPQKQRFAVTTGYATKLLPLLLFLALPAVLHAQFLFVTNNGAITITGYTGPGGAVVIPSETNGLPVTSIKDQAFHNCPSMTSLTIPHSVTNIGVGAFGNCINLSEFIVDASSSAYSTSVGILFNQSQSTLIAYPGGKTGAYAVPSSVTNIGDFALAWCYNLTGVTIPDGVISIGVQAFWNDNALTSVVIPSSVASIAASAFGACHSLPAITVDAQNPFYPGFPRFASHDNVIDLQRSRINKGFHLCQTNEKPRIQRVQARNRLCG